MFGWRKINQRESRRSIEYLRKNFSLKGPKKYPIKLNENWTNDDDKLFIFTKSKSHSTILKVSVYENIKIIK